MFYYASKQSVEGSVLYDKGRDNSGCSPCLIKVTGKGPSEFSRNSRTKDALSCCSIYLIPDQFNHPMICEGEKVALMREEKMIKHLVCVSLWVAVSLLGMM